MIFCKKSRQSSLSHLSCSPCRYFAFQSQLRYNYQSIGSQCLNAKKKPPPNLKFDNDSLYSVKISLTECVSTDVIDTAVACSEEETVAYVGVAAKGCLSRLIAYIGNTCSKNSVNLAIDRRSELTGLIDYFKKSIREELAPYSVHNYRTDCTTSIIISTCFAEKKGCKNIQLTGIAGYRGIDLRGLLCCT